MSIFIFSLSAVRDWERNRRKKRFQKHRTSVNANGSITKYAKMNEYGWITNVVCFISIFSLFWPFSLLFYLHSVNPFTPDFISIRLHCVLSGISYRSLWLRRWKPKVEVLYCNRSSWNKPISSFCCLTEQRWPAFGSMVRYDDNRLVFITVPFCLLLCYVEKATRECYSG